MKDLILSYKGYIIATILGPSAAGLSWFWLQKPSPE